MNKAVRLCLALWLSALVAGVAAQEGPRTPQKRLLDVGAETARSTASQYGRAHALAAAAAAYDRAGFDQAALAVVDEAVAAWHSGSVPPRWLVRFSIALAEAGAPARARRAAESLTDLEERADAFSRIAVGEAALGRLDLATESLLAAVAAAGGIEEEHLRARALAHAGRSCREVQSPDVAGPILQDLTELAKEFKRQQRDTCLADLAEAAHDLGLPELAAEAALGMADPAAATDRLLALARRSVESEDSQAAAAILAAAGKTAAACPKPADRARLLAQIAVIHGEAGDAEAANDAVALAAGALEQNAAPERTAPMWMAFVRAYLSTGRPDDALAVADTLPRE